ncbi:hypothetical protein K4L06_14365 [Lysobacter sp. BMK333-48F3]|uniref:hypothetical protein n=1 Tax=Lysobacter sp. BMK333-48F3 TaxID=2867962 RepID=UPI001C8C3F54|nr:hypothetical protein [Lysobacter sp. BMK333-48F3]MBX9402493.1 hypothetical protein [Lysobacter sp. BMK333-48F3]
MNRRPDAPDPLSAEERELADRLLRLGPHDGPSPALDARILAAAHAAVAQAPRARPRSRWPAWIGVAASLTLAVGIAWQLRPAGKSFEAVGEDQAALPASAPAAVAEQAASKQAASATADSAATAELQAQDAAPPPPPSIAADAAGQIVETVEPLVAAPATPARMPPPAEPAQREQADEAAKAEQRAEPLRARRAPQAFSPEAPAPIELPAPPPPPAPPAPPAAAAAAPPSGAAAPGAASAGADNDGYRAAELQRAPAPTAAHKASAANAAEAKAAAATADSAAESAVLDRVQVTGSRIRTVGTTGVPADADAADARLAPAQWLQRIREYRDAGQTERARDGLRRFRSAHPRVRIPDDLRPLLK